MDLSDFSERIKASASYERQCRRITGDNDDDDNEEPVWYNDATTDARVYATGITAKRSGAVGTLFIIPTISRAPISRLVRARNLPFLHFSLSSISLERRRTRSFPSLYFTFLSHYRLFFPKTTDESWFRLMSELRDSRNWIKFRKKFPTWVPTRIIIIINKSNENTFESSHVPRDRENVILRRLLSPNCSLDFLVSGRAKIQFTFHALSVHLN